MQILQSIDRVGIGVNNALHTLLLGKRPPAPVHVEPPRAGIDLDDRSGFGSRLDDGGNIHGIGVAGKKKSTRQVPHHRHVRIPDRTNDPLGHRLLIGREARVNRCDHVVERREDLVREVEITLLEDVALGACEELKASLLEFLGGIQLPDLGYLLGKAGGIESARLE